MAKTSHVAYENNPFIIGLEGIKLFFNKAQPVAIYAVVASIAFMIIGLFFAFISIGIDIASTMHLSESQIAARDAAEAQAAFHAISQASLSDVVMFSLAVIGGLLVYLAVCLLLFGVCEYSAAQIAQNKKVTLGEAFKAVLTNFPSYFWLYVLVGIKIFLWSLLLIVPGVIMAYRYILSGTVFFAEGKRGNAAIQRSSELTKGAWLTTFAGFSLWNFIGQGLITLVTFPGAFAILYRQLKAKTDSGTTKPPAHWLSWLTFWAPIVLFVVFIALTVLIILTGLILSDAYHL